MFNFLGKIAEKISLTFSFLNRNNSPSSKLIQKNNSGDNVGGDKIVNNNYSSEEPTTMTDELIYAWATSAEMQENEKVGIYEFDFILQNKSERILKDLWINFSSSGVHCEIEKTEQSALFEGQDVYGKALQLMSSEKSKFPPQGFINPFKLRIVIKKKEISDGWLYISFGSSSTNKVELKIDFAKAKQEEFLAFDTRTNTDFLKHFGLATKVFG